MNDMPFDGLTAEEIAQRLDEIAEGLKAQEPRQQPLPRRIAMFTPLPPQKTGIANYSWDILQSMGKLCVVDVFIEDGCAVNIPPIPNVQIYRASAYAGKNKGYDATLYQIGNSPFHSYMLPWLRKYGGVVELHEANLNAWLFHDLVRTGQDWSAYRNALLSDNEQGLVDDYIAKIQAGHPFDSDAMLANSFVVNYASALIVHNTYTKRQLLQADIGRKVAVVPHYAKAQQIYPKQEARVGLDIPREGIVFASFGAVAQNRRLTSAIYAMKTLAAQNVPAQLYITGGDDWGTLYDCKALVRSLGLQDHVYFTGRLSDALFWRYLAACDVVLSLRWPYRGESSGVMCQALAAGKPQIVTDVGCFGELPDAVCCKLPPPNPYSDERAEANLVACAMGLFAQDSARREKMGEAAQKYAEESLQADDLAAQILCACALPQPSRRLQVDESLLQAIANSLKVQKGTPSQVEEISRLLACLK